MGALFLKRSALVPRHSINRKKGRCPMTPATDLLGKRVLLVDRHQKARETRANRLSVYGIAVDAVCTIREARVRLGMNRYDLVLLATRENPEDAITFRREIRQQNPKQRVAFLVGPPDYLSFTFGQNLIPMPPRPSDWADKVKTHLASA
jgi:PleD family two-component response regulator